MKAQLIGASSQRSLRQSPNVLQCPGAAKQVRRQAAYESVFSRSWERDSQGGGQLILHSAGWLEGGLRCSYEKMMLDIDLLQMVAEF